MFCPNCGKEANNGDNVCSNCGYNLKSKSELTSNANHNSSKAVVGFLLAFFLGLIGLIIGICLYPSGTVARKTFLKAWAITYGVAVVLMFILLSITYSSILSEMI